MCVVLKKFQQCHLVSLQRYTKAPTIFQRSKLVKESVQKPQEKMNVLNNVRVFKNFILPLFFFVLILIFKFHWQAIKDSGYNNDPMLQDCGVSIGSNFTQVEGRVLPTPRVWLTLLLLQVNIDRVTPFES